MDNYSLISQLPITSVLDKLWIKYSKVGPNCLWLWQNWRLTDWWRVKINENYVKDFSRDRPYGSPYLFVKLYMKLSDKETFQRFADNFDVENRNRNINKKYFNKKREPMKLPKYYSNW